MKVLWISNVLFPEACKELNIKTPVIGGWMNSSALALLDTNPNIQLAVAALYPGKEFRCLDNYKIKYYLIPDKGGDEKYNTRLEPYYLNIKNDFRPDLVHIFGSECPHSLAWVRACGNKNVVVSIQGLVSSISKYYLGGISIREVKQSVTCRDIIRRDSLFNQQKKMQKRGGYELELLKTVDHIIGRTSWDRSNTWAINSKANYYHCHETLRTTFYQSEWKYKNCESHTIFLSQANYPIKGLQQIVTALPLILKHYPQTVVYVAGNNFMNPSFLRKNGFANYMIKLMKAKGVTERFRFLGVLKEEEMANQYLKANVFVCPSNIENSSNSLGEAQLLGTPCIASFVGGNMDMITDCETGFLYRYEETNILAKRICEIFSDQNLAESIGEKGKIVAAERHNKKSNAEALNQIYKLIHNENTFDL